MSVARINLSHGQRKDHQEFVDMVRQVQSEGFCIAILLDSKGAEIRTGDVQDPIPIAKGEEVLFVSDADHKNYTGDQKIIRVNYDGFARDVLETKKILIDNGELSFDIVSIDAGLVTARAREEGTIGSRRHVNLPGADIDLPSVTEKDWDDIAYAVEQDVDFFALSFIRTAEEVLSVRKFLNEQKSSVRIITKVETQQAVENIPSLVEVSDGVMVARGDLGAEVPFERLPVIQEDIVSRCRDAGKPVIVATHMLESMTQHPLPTRAEVTDVAHAAGMRTDATMLSGETAGGRHPLTAIDAMDRILRATEEQMSRFSRDLSEDLIHDEREARAEAVVSLANAIGAPAIVVITRRGLSAQEISKFRPCLPIVALTDSPSVQRKLALSYGVFPLVLPFNDDLEDTAHRALRAAADAGFIQAGQQVVLLSDTQTHDGAVASIQVRTLN